MTWLWWIILDNPKDELEATTLGQSGQKLRMRVGF